MLRSFTPAGVWIANPRNGTVTWIDPKTLRIIEAIGLGAGAIEIATGGGGVGEVLKVDPSSGTITKRIRVGGNPWGMAFGAGRLWVTVD
ncbi:MAG: hypothetical protein H0W90_05495 [Actinobacteria bacterium]|nr:hypothetical protein [Actinomycetota bacterium]